MNAHFSLMFGDAVAHPQLPQLQFMAAQLIRGWRGLWAQYGTDPAGQSQYKALLDRFMAQAMPMANPVVLANGGSFAASMSMLIQKSALRAGTQADSGEYGPVDRA